MRLIDTHCHIDLYPDYDAVLSEVERAGIYTIAVTNTPSVFRRCVELTQHTRFVRVALGLHPELAATRGRELRLLDELLPTTRYVGEVGLDWMTQDSAERSAQRQVFNAILERCAASGDKVLSVHSRRAAAEVLAMVGPSYPGIIILHWFSGPRSVVDQALRQGCYFSVNPAMLASAAGYRVVSALPPERVLTETDGPFVVAHGRPARPADVAGVVSELARLWGVEANSGVRRIYDNFRQVLDHGPAT